MPWILVETGAGSGALSGGFSSVGASSFWNLGSSGLGGSCFGGGGHGSKFGFYAGQVKGRLLDALRENKKTRSAVMDVQVRVWLDESGHVSRVALSKSTGNPSLDEALKTEVFNEISMGEPPPQGMPMPIVMHFSAKRPG